MVSVQDVFGPHDHEKIESMLRKKGNDQDLFTFQFIQIE